MINWDFFYIAIFITVHCSPGNANLFCKDINRKADFFTALFDSFSCNGCCHVRVLLVGVISK